MFITINNSCAINIAVRWSFSTNRRDIGVLYLIFAAVSVVAETALSMHIRASLTQPNSDINICVLQKSIQFSIQNNG